MTQDRKSTGQTVIGFMPAEAIAPLYNEMLGRAHDFMLVEQDNIMALRICRLLLNECDDRELQPEYGAGNVITKLETAYGDGNERIIWTI